MNAPRLALVALLVVAALPFGCSQKKEDEQRAKPSEHATKALEEAIASASRATSAASAEAEKAKAMGTATASAAASVAAPDAVAAQHVLVAYKGAEKAPKTVTRSKADAKKRADEVAAKAKGGADFSKLVAEYSDDPAKGERQGSVGKFTRDKMNKAFSDAAFGLKVDETSDPVETPFGFHVIRRNQ